jgi:hypothetical protein
MHRGRHGEVGLRSTSERGLDTAPALCYTGDRTNLGERIMDPISATTLLTLAVVGAALFASFGSRWL